MHRVKLAFGPGAVIYLLRKLPGPGPGTRGGETMAEETKLALAKAMEELMRSQSVEAVTVTDVARRANVTRQTFYRHFLDKYDLINWYFGKLLSRSFEHMGTGRTVREGLERKFEYIRAERVFFTAAFRADGTNSLKEHDVDAIMAFYSELIERKTGAPPEGETAFLLELYCRGSVAMTVRWVLGGMRAEPAELARFMVDSLPAPLRELFLRLGLL